MAYERTILTTGVVLLTLALATMAPAADPRNAANCAPRDKVVERLAGTYGETRRSIGLGANNALIEVYASDDSGSWTITETLPSGLTCLVASGQAFETLADTPPATGKGA
ncbi:hypothetical protein ACFQ3C_13175 [Seohaeicola saemankumensis]|uniref:Uncharacterized protein n=1 Tax=Seohaeicola saemankumensis TaxID=481181 RepID=A0ABW3TEK1_9RHOB